jgi:hypothetical protein
MNGNSGNEKVWEEAAAGSRAANKRGFIKAKQYWIIFGFGAILIIIARLIEDVFPQYFPWLIASATSDPHHLTGSEFLALYMKELGVAFLVAGIVIRVVEKRAKELDNERADQLRREVAHDAIFSIYGLRHRTDFINATIETNLQARIVRENMTMKYEVRAPTREEAELVLPSAGEDALQRFAVLEMELRYTFRNVASKESSFLVPCTMPLRQGEGARSLTKATYVSLGGVSLTEQQIADAAQARAEELVYQWNYTLSPGGTLDLVIYAQCLKERSDAEVWGSLFPTMGDITLSMTVPAGLSFGVRDHSNAILKEEPGPNSNSKTWTMSGPLLTHNSIIFWWRIPEDDAKDETSPPAEYSMEKPLADHGMVEPRRGIFRWALGRLLNRRRQPPIS